MLRPNPPRMITVAIAVVLIVVGISATIFPVDFVDAAFGVVQSYVGTDLVVTREMGWLFLFAGDALLVIGSLLPGI
ncbi:MAG TPA: hypothetical protein VFK93_04730 [Candidatus Limnocylindria bacterium]|jgi:hypothetical protein|nr:hypothetical protein [Candidatus Limnocylindria bacterium]